MNRNVKRYFEPLLLFVFLFPLIVHAQIPANDDFVQTELNALFVVNEERNQTTGFFNIGYMTNLPDTITWIFPLPPGAIDIETLSPLLIPTLEQKTRPILGTPGTYVCDLQVTNLEYWALIPRREYIASNQNIIDVNLSFEDLLEQLPQSPDQQQLDSLQDYAELGWTFTTVSFSPPANRLAGEMQLDFPHIYTSPTISFTFPGTEPVLPTALHAPVILAQFDDSRYENAYTVTAFIAAEKPYVPQDQELVKLSFDDLRGTNMIENMQAATSSGYTGEFSLYYRRLANAANADHIVRYNIESITNPQEIVEQIAEDGPSAVQIIADKSYLTRLRTIVTDERNIALMSRFEPDENYDYILYDTTRLIDPAIYWGCTTEETEDSALEARLPSSRTYIDVLNAHVAHPADWQLSVLEDGVRYAFAQQTVNNSDIYFLEMGQGEFPILVLERLEFRYEIGELDYQILPEHTWEWFTRYTSNFGPVPMRNAVSIYFPTGVSNLRSVTVLGEDYPPITGYRAVLMAPLEDWIDNGSLYDDMLGYLRTYPYFTSPELRHTLVLGELGNAFAIGYPQGWHTRQDQNLGRLIAPENRKNSAYVRIYDVERPDFNLTSLTATYDLSVDGFDEMEPQAFQDVGGRSGYVMYIDSGEYDIPLIEFSAPVEIFDSYASLLLHMAEVVIHFDGQIATETS